MIIYIMLKIENLFHAKSVIELISGKCIKIQSYDIQTPLNCKTQICFDPILPA